MERVGFIGTGVMGHAMAGHLMDAGYELFVYNRTQARTDDLVERGATWCASPGDVAAQVEAVITMVGYPTDVREVYFGPDGILDNAKPGTLVIDMTTSSPALAIEIAEQANANELRALDAPVSGGDVGARNATLTIMVGGAQADFAAAMPLFEAMGSTFALHGGAGKGQHCKMANQINIAATMMGMAESLAYARAVGLDPQRVIETLSGGSAQTWSLSNYGPRVLKSDYAPGFYVKHFVKDLRIALEEAKAAGIELPGTEQAFKLYRALEEGGSADEGTQAIMRLYLGD